MGVWHIIINEYEYLPPDKVLIELFETSLNQKIVELSGKKLQKSKEEITARIEQINPQYKKNIQAYEDAQQKKALKKKTKSLFSIQNFIYLIIGLTLVFVFWSVWRSLT